MTKASKIEEIRRLLKGDKPPRKVQIVLTRNEAGHVIIESSYLLPPSVSVNIVINEVLSKDDIEFWKNFDATELINQEIKRLTDDQGTTGKTMKIKSLSRGTTDLITEMYNEQF
jgi:hypothetical protein